MFSCMFFFGYLLGGTLAAAWDDQWGEWQDYSDDNSQEDDDFERIQKAFAVSAVSCASVIALLYKWMVKPAIFFCVYRPSAF